jgi:hypothetical protein
MKRLAASLGLFALAACGDDTPQGRAAPAATQAVPAAQAAPAPAAAAQPIGGWAMQASAAAGTALVHTADDGGEDLRVACRRNPAELWVSAPRLRRIGSEERLSLGAGDQVTALVADLQAQGAGVEATGPVAPEFLAGLRAGGDIAVSYGSQTLSLSPPQAALAERFAAACAG